MEQRCENVWFDHAVLNYIGWYTNQNDEIIKNLQDSEYYHMMDYNPYETKIIDRKIRVLKGRSQKTYLFDQKIIFQEI